MTLECFSWPTNSYQSININLTSFREPPSLSLFTSSIPHSLSLQSFWSLVGWFVCFLIDMLGLVVIHQFGLTALSLSAGWVFGCGYNTLKVGWVLSFAPNIEQDVGRSCTYRVWSRPRYLLNRNELDFRLLPSFKFHSYFLLDTLDQG